MRQAERRVRCSERSRDGVSCLSGEFLNDGFGAPDWLLRKAEGSKHYPHNLYLEMLYETGIIGLLLFGIITLYPLGVSLNRWNLFSSAERSAIARPRPRAPPNRSSRSCV